MVLIREKRRVQHLTQLGGMKNPIVVTLMRQTYFNNETRAVA